MQCFNKNFESKFENVTETCKSVFGFLSDNKLPEKVCREIELCLAESLNNVIIHSYNKQPDKLIELSVCLINYDIEIKIKDSGKASTNLGKPTLEFDPDDIESLPEGGMGLYIIDQIMDETNYSTEGTTNTLTMIKNLL